MENIIKKRSLRSQGKSTMIWIFVFLTSLTEIYTISSTSNIGPLISTGLDSRFQSLKERGDLFYNPRHKFTHLKNLIFPQSIYQKLIGKDKSSSEDFHPNSVLTDFSNENSQDFKESLRQLPDEIVWRQCSGKKLTAYLDSNVKIRCALWAPLGTKITWYKDGLIKFVQEHNEIEGQRLLSADDVENYQTYLDNKGRSKYEFHVVSLYYIDCVTLDDEGTYEIVVETPSGRNYSRNFEFKTSGYSYLYSVCCENCFLYTSTNFFKPRIIDFAKTVIGKMGQELHLPCRPEINSSLTVFWNKVDRELSNEGYSITELGDLKIHNLTLEDEGMYKCELYHSQFFIKYDRIQTYVSVSD
ncbi:UNVERIFIED_CONTAM: hypothetical protein RMT77_003268 [Armadillidium vulgare]